MSVTRRFYRYLKPHGGRISWALSAMLLVALINGLSVLLLKPIVDKIFISRDFGMLWLAVIGVPLLIALKTAASYVQNYMMSWLGQRVCQELREDLFRQIHALPLGYYSSHRSGEVLTRATGDLFVVQSALTSLPLYLVRDSLTVLILLVSLFYLDWHFALLSLIGVPLMAAVFIVLSRKMRAASLISQSLMSRIHQRFEEGIHAAATIRAFNYEEGTIAKFKEENDSFFAPTMSYLRATALAAPLMELSGAVVAAAILYFGGCEVILGRMTPGEFFAFLGAFFAAYAPIKNLARSNSELQRALASSERIFQLLDEHPASLLAPGAAAFTGLKAEIRFDRVFFRYPGRTEPALKGVSFSIPKGKRTALVGRSGSGKTTISQLLLRLHDIPEGDGAILFDGIDARRIDAHRLRSEIAVVGQDTTLFDDTVFANVALGRDVVTLSEVERACRIAGADGFIAGLPDGYQTRVGDWGHALSAGQRQKIGIARVVLRDPSILVLDEATASLDPSSEAELLAALGPLLEGRTVIFIAHKVSALPHCDQIVVLNQGELAELGGHAELLKRDGFYKKMFELQEASLP